LMCFLASPCVLAVFVKKVVRFSKWLTPRFLVTSDAPVVGLATPL
jgi:hypothetical protein